MMSDSIPEYFRQTLTGTIVSSLGYRVTPQPRAHIKYVEGEMKVIADAELMGRPLGYILFISSIPESFDGERDLIANRIRRAVESIGGEVELAEP